MLIRFTFWPNQIEKNVRYNLKIVAQFPPMNDIKEDDELKQKQHGFVTNTFKTR